MIENKRRGAASVASPDELSLDLVFIKNNRARTKSEGLLKGLYKMVEDRQPNIVIKIKDKLEIVHMCRVEECKKRIISPIV